MPYQLNPQQAQIARSGLQLTANDPQIIQRSLIEAMLVESAMRQIPGGDRDSTGVLQQRPSMGWGAYKPGLAGATQDMNDYLARARKLVRGGFHGTAGQLAQSVQRSAFPERYDQAKAKALSIIQQYGGTSASPTMAGPRPMQIQGQPNAGVDQARNALMQNIIGQQNEFASTGKITNSAPTTQLWTQLLNSQREVSLGQHKVQVDHDQPVSPLAGGIVAQAKQYLGTPYKWGGSTPKGFDCSGFVQFLWKQNGVNLPRTTYDQIKAGPKIGMKDLQPGDPIFFSNKGDVHHEGLYIGNGQFIHAPHTGDVIKISSLSEPYYAQQFAGGIRVQPRK